MFFRTVSSLLLVRLPNVRIRSLSRDSSQHCNSWKITSLPVRRVAAFYSDHRCLKYTQSSLVPAAATAGRLTFSALTLGGAEAVCGSWVGGWAVRAWRSMSHRRTSGSVESDQDWVQTGAGQGILGILGWAGGFHCVMIINDYTVFLIITNDHHTYNGSKGCSY